MFLTNNDNRRSVSINDDSNSHEVNFLLEVMDLNEEWYNFSMKAMKAEHDAIVNEDVQLLQEVEESFFSRVIAWFKAMLARIKQFILGLWDWIKSKLFGSKSYLESAKKQLKDKNFKHREVNVKIIEADGLKDKNDEVTTLVNKIQRASDVIENFLNSTSYSSSTDTSDKTLTIKPVHTTTGSIPTRIVGGSTSVIGSDQTGIMDALKDGIDKFKEDIDEKDVDNFTPQDGIKMIDEMLAHFKSGSGNTQKALEKLEKEAEKKVKLVEKHKNNPLGKGGSGLVMSLRKLMDGCHTMVGLMGKHVKRYISINTSAINKLLHGKNELEESYGFGDVLDRY